MELGDWVQSKANHPNVVFPFKASYFGLLMEIYYSSSSNVPDYLSCM